MNLEYQRTEGFTSDEVLYADDTICLAQTEPAMNKLLMAIEREGTKYGMKLNFKKCEYLQFGKGRAVHFLTHKLKPQEEVKYLGCLLNDDADPLKEIQKR